MKETRPLEQTSKRTAHTCPSKLYPFGFTLYRKAYTQLPWTWC